jgi:hypothetical protein
MSRVHRFAAASAAVALLGLSGLTHRATAQITANAAVNATAFVQGIAPLTAAGTQNLDFGTVNAGTAGTITNPGTNAGRYDISGEPLRPVTITFTKPSVLTGSGAATIPIVFGGSDGLLWNSAYTTFTTFSPNGSFLTSIDAAGNLIIGIRATVNPLLGTSTGTYTGTITLQVDY